MPVESALVVLIPEAESLVEAFRKRFDPSAAIGVPAHVTVLYPFKSPDALTDEVTATLRELFQSLPGFTASFFEVSRFPNALFLKPDPAWPFKRMTETIARAFPVTPPFGGAFKEIIPHLTVVELDDLQQMDEIAADFQEAARGKLPIHARINTVSLMDNSSGYWQIRVQFSLRPDKQPS